MPSATSITLADSVPANHTFAPQSVTPENSVLVDRDSVTSAGFKKLQIGFSPAKSTRSTNRVTIRMAVPTETTVDSVTSVAYTARIAVDVVLPEEMTLTERADLWALFQSAMGNADIAGYVETLDPLY